MQCPVRVSLSRLLGPCAHSVSVCVCEPARCACQRCLAPCTWRGNQSGYRCSSSALPISGWRFCGGLSDRYCSCVVLLSVSLPVPESVLAWLLFGIPGGCGLDWILCPSWRLCTAGLTAPALPDCLTLHLHYVLESAPALPGYLHLHCVLELSNKDCLFHSQLDLELLFRDKVNSTAELTLMLMYVALFSILRRRAADRMCAVAWYNDIFSKADRGDICIVHDQTCSYRTLLSLADITDRGQHRQNMRFFSLALNGGGRFLSPSSPLSSLLCSLVSWETLSALLSKLKYYGLTGLLMQLTLSKLGFWGTWLPWRNVRRWLHDGAWERWRIVCLAALCVEDIDIYLFGTMITGILLIGLGFALGYRRIQKTGTAVQSPTRLPVWLKLWEEWSALRLRL